MVYAQLRICPGEWDAQTPLGLWHTNGSPNVGQKTRLYNDQQQKKKKRTCKVVNFAVSADHWIKLKESEKKDKYVDLARGLKKLWNMKMTLILIVNFAFDTVTTDDWYKDIGIRTGRLGNNKTSGEHLNYHMIKIGQNTEKSLGDLRRLADTQTPVRNYRQTLVLKIIIIIIISPWNTKNTPENKKRIR